MNTVHLNPKFLSYADKRRYWTNVITGWYVSGLRMKPFCHRHAICQAVMRRWVWKLHLARPVISKTLLGSSEQGDKDLSLHFMPVTLESISSKMPASTSGICLCFPSGKRVVLEPYFDEGALVRLLGVLGDASC